MKKILIGLMVAMSLVSANSPQMCDLALGQAANSAKALTLAMKNKMDVTYYAIAVKGDLITVITQCDGLLPEQVKSAEAMLKNLKKIGL